MKEIIEKKMVEQVTHTWIAADGTQFSSERECIHYENTYRRDELKKRFERLLVMNVPNIPFIDWSYDTGLYIINVETPQEKYLMEDYFKEMYCNCYLDDEIKDYFGKMIIIHSEDYVSVYKYNHFADTSEKLRAAADFFDQYCV